MLCNPFPSVGYTWSYVNPGSRVKLNPHPHQWQFSQGPTHLMTKMTLVQVLLGHFIVDDKESCFDSASDLCACEASALVAI